MSDLTPLTDEAIFALIADQLEPATVALGGKFSRALDPFQVMELLGQGPGTFRVILHDDGEDKAGDAECPKFVTRRYKVTVSTNRGLPLMAGQPVTQGDATTPALLSRVSRVRDAMRGFELPPRITSGRLFYQGRQVVLFDGARLDAYELTFLMHAALPAAGS